MSESKKQKQLKVIFGVMVVLFLAMFISYRVSTSDYFNKRIQDTEEMKTSSRDKIYEHCVDLIVNDNSVTHLLIGRGAYASIANIGIMAHQDWLETALNNGLLGICILLYFCFVFFRTVTRKNDGMPEYIHSACLMTFFIFILRTMFSMSLAEIQCFQSMLISYCIFMQENNRNVTYLGMTI